MAASRSQPVVLHVVQSLNWGGMERIVVDLTHGLRTKEFDVHLLNLQFVGPLGDGLGDPSRVHVASKMSRLSMLYPAALARDIARINPSIVHTHSGVWYKASLAARRAGVPIVVHTDHGRPLREPWHERQLERLASRRTDAVIAVSEALGTHLHVMLGRAAGRIAVIPNGIDVRTFSPVGPKVDIANRFQLEPRTPIIGSVGRLEQIKGYDVLIDAFAALDDLPAAGPAPHLVLIGDGSERARLTQRAHTLGVGRRIHFVGWQRNIAEWLRSFTVFAMSSHSEGTSVSLLEAMAVGVAPVVSRVGGNPAVMGPSLSNNLVMPANPSALASRLAELLASEERRRHDAQLALERAHSQFSVSRMVTDYAQLYGSLLAGR